MVGLHNDWIKFKYKCKCKFIFNANIYLITTEKKKNLIK